MNGNVHYSAKFMHIFLWRWQKTYPLDSLGNHYPAKCYIPASNPSVTKIFSEESTAGFGLTI